MNQYFNAHHSPAGAFATLTLGCKGPKGGLGLELAGPANESIYVGIEEEEGIYRALPFYGGSEIAAEDYDVEGLSDLRYASAIQPFRDSEIAREFGAGIDEWRAGDLTFRIVSPPRAVPDPTQEHAKDAVAPGILIELTIDNRQGSRPRRAFFGYSGSDRSVGMRILDEPGLVGVGQGTSIAIATQDENVYAGLAWQPEAILSPRLPENLGFMLGSTGLLVATVPAGEIKTFRFAVAFFREGTATSGIRTRYLYRRWFDRIEDVLEHTLTKADELKEQAQAFDQALASRLSPTRYFMAAHAIRSYFGCTQLLEREDGTPLWCVHEGEYRMMNTFDLTVDQAFFELALNPWTVKNVLDLFVERYSYVDEVRFPGKSETHPGGIAFTHDMGVSNTFSPEGRSGYEQAGLTGCFSYMSAEELMNWVLCAGLYVGHTKDEAWLQTQRQTIHRCLASLLNRDHPEAEQRNGLMGLDGARCAGGAEITTYDSLDASLGQARNNLYLGVKGWAAYLVLQDLFTRLGDKNEADESLNAARRAAHTVIEAKDENGLLPAVVGEGVDARIIPAIEGLVYPHVLGYEDEFTELRQVLKNHFELVLQPGICRFADNGWRLSSTSRNSWLSKIYLCQYIAENIFGHEEDAQADEAHKQWLLDEENAYYAWSDQMLEGKAVGSRYYPRGVTSILWTAKGSDPLTEISHFLDPHASTLTHH
jgi:hypothetical protein